MKVAIEIEPTPINSKKRGIQPSVVGGDVEPRWRQHTSDQNADV